MAFTLRLQTQTKIPGRLKDDLKPEAPNVIPNPHVLSPGSSEGFPPHGEILSFSSVLN